MTVTRLDLERLEDALVARLPTLLDEVSARLREHWPDYADFLDADRDGMADAATLFVRRLLELSEPGLQPAGRQPGDVTVQLVFEQIGRQEMQVGNDLTRLLTAFQLGARVAWQHVSATALEMGLPPDSLASLADAVFGFVSQLSFAAARGYLQAQADDSRARERSREELAELLLTGRTNGDALRSAAARADWRIPARAAIVLVDPEDEPARRIVDRLGPTALPVRRPPLLAGAIVPDPATGAGRAGLARQLRGAHAVVGYAVPLDRLARSAEVTLTVMDLRRTGLVAGDPVFAEEHLDTIIVRRDESLMRVLRQQVLAPLDGVPDGTRDRLTETLTSWLQHQGDRRTMAEELSIHPQTVRYRMGQLHELFGDALDSPRARARLFLALCWPDAT